MAKKPKQSQPFEKLDELAEELERTSGGLTGPTATKARKKIAEVVGRLQGVAIGLDPVREPGSVFNPANPSTVGLFVSIALLAQEREPLESVKPFYGSGVYAIYYNGNFPAYAQLVGTEHPIYVGKADPPSAEARTPRQQEQRLFRRVKEHAGTILEAAANLKIEDFTCRHLVVASGMQTAAEDYLIHLFRPIWNKQVKIAYGIGKHGDDPETRANKRSPWDTLHQGRDWAHRDPEMKDQRSPAEVVAKIKEHFKKHPPFKDIDAVLHQFYQDLKQK